MSSPAKSDAPASRPGELDRRAVEIISTAIAGLVELGATREAALLILAGAAVNQMERRQSLLDIKWQVTEELKPTIDTTFGLN
jgi:hypothetical protein